MWSKSTHSGIQDIIECPYIICYVVLSNDKLVILTHHVASYLYWVYSPRDISDLATRDTRMDSHPDLYQIWQRGIREWTHTQIYIRFGDEGFIKRTLIQSIRLDKWHSFFFCHRIRWTSWRRKLFSTHPEI